MNETPAERLEVFLDRFTPEVAKVGRASLNKLAKRLPTADRLVYDNYNALAIGFCASPKPSHLIVSIVLYPKWASLFFPNGARLPDPQRRLTGKGAKWKHVVLHTSETLDDPAVSNLIDASLKAASPPLREMGKGLLIIQSISAKQRPRRPAEWDGTR